VVFGHGHPITSGSEAVDYFVSSQLHHFHEHDGEALLLDHPTAVYLKALSCLGLGLLGGGQYVEQLVQFDTLTTGALPPPDPTPTNRSAWGLREEDHVYVCLQHSKKLHPTFDDVIIGIATADPSARSAQRLPHP
jgi:hypothetical protein